MAAETLVAVKARIFYALHRYCIDEGMLVAGGSSGNKLGGRGDPVALGRLKLLIATDSSSSEGIYHDRDKALCIDTALIEGMLGEGR